MNKSVSVMSSFPELSKKLRIKYFGETASVKDYKDSFVVNHMIQSFNGRPSDLMTDKITGLDDSDPKVSKSLNFRSDCYEKIETFAKALKIPESEVLRRIMYYSLETRNAKKDPVNLSDLKKSAAKLKEQMEESMAALNDLMIVISMLEGKEKR